MEHTDKDFRLKISVRNNRLLKLIEKQRHPTLAAFAAAAGLSYGTFHELLRMSRSPRWVTGEWSPIAMKIATFLRVEPEDIWPEHMIKIAKPVSVEVSLDELPMLQREPTRAFLPAIESDEIKQRVRNALAMLPPRLAEILSLHYGLDGPEMTQSELAAKMGLSRERVRQMILKGLRYMGARRFTSEMCEYDKTGISVDDMDTLARADA